MWNCRPTIQSFDFARALIPPVLRLPNINRTEVSFAHHSVAPAWGFPTFRGQQAWHGTALRVAELLTPPPERDCQPQSLHLGKRGSEEEVASSTTFSLQIQTSPRGRGGPRGKAGTGQPSPPAGGTPGNLLPAESLMCLAASSLLRHPRSSLHVGSFVAAHRL